MTCPRSRRTKFISWTTVATILMDEIDSATPRKSAITSRCCVCGIKSSGRKNPRTTPQANGMATPVSETLIAGRPTVRMSLRSVSIPVSSKSSNTPTCAMPSSIALWAASDANSACCSCGSRKPKKEGPSRMPAASCPTTAGWPRRCIASLRMRDVSRIATSAARKLVADGSADTPSAAIAGGDKLIAAVATTATVVDLARNSALRTSSRHCATPRTDSPRHLGIKTATAMNSPTTSRQLIMTT